MMGKNTLAARIVSLMAAGALAFSLVPSLAFADTMTRAQALAYIDAAKIKADAGNDLSEDDIAKVSEAVDMLDDADYSSSEQQVFALKVKVRQEQEGKEAAQAEANTLAHKVETAESNATKAEASLSEAQALASANAKEAQAAISELDDANKQIAKLTKQLAKAQSNAAAQDKILIKGVKVSGLSAKGGSESAVLSWKVSNAISGLKYQVKYRKSGASKWSKMTSKKKSCTVSGLTKNTNYQFKVRAFKKISGKRVYTSYTAVAVAKALQKYKTGDYKVNDTMGVNVRKKATTSGAKIAAFGKGTKVNITKVVTGSDGEIWGYGTGKALDGKTYAGYMYMKLLKAA